MELILDQINDTKVNGMYFQKLIDENLDEMKIISPYISDLNLFDYKKVLKRIKDVKIICNLDSPSCNPRVIYELSKYCNIKYREDIHSKTYITPNKAILGSANLTRNGMEDNIEASVLMTDSERVNEIHSWFNTIWQDSGSLNVKDITDNKWKELFASYDIRNNRLKNKKSHFFDLLLSNQLKNVVFGFYYEGAVLNNKEVEELVKKRRIILPKDWSYWEEVLINKKEKTKIAEGVKKIQQLSEKYKNYYFINLCYTPSDREEIPRKILKKKISVTQLTGIVEKCEYKKDEVVLLDFYTTCGSKELPFSITDKQKNNIFISLLNKGIENNSEEWAKVFTNNKYYGSIDINTLKNRLLKGISLE